MYRIIQVLNNNVAIVRMANDEQAIVMGKGIVFQKKKGDLLPEEKISKLFMLRDKESQKNFSTLLKDIPLDFITTAYEIIDEAVHKYKYPVQEYLYVTLTDHLYWSYTNLRNGTYEPSKLPDISQQYPVEFLIGTDAVALVRERLWMDFPDDEITRIALHFINAKRQEAEAPLGTEDVGQDILQLVRQELDKNGIHRSDQNQNFYDRLMIHLAYFVDRLEDETEEQNAFSKELEADLQRDYPEAYQISDNLYQLIEKQINKKLSGTERVYLTLHIQRLL